MQSKTKYNNKYDIILFGGDRLLEKGPLSQLSIYLKHKNISYISILYPIHAKKKVAPKLSLRKYLSEKKINYLIIDKVSKLNLKNYLKKNTLGLSINSIWKFTPKTIKNFNGKLYNYHAGDLPTERGAATITWRILLNKHKNLSINIHKIGNDFDTGKIVKKKNISITNKDRLPYQHLKRIEKVEKIFLKEFIMDYIRKRKFMKKTQQNEKSYYWPKLNSEKDGLIDWNWKAKEIVEFIKAFSKPFNGSFSYLNKTKVKIMDAKFLKSDIKFHPFQNGIIFRFYKNNFYIANRDHFIKISKSQIIGLKKRPSFYLGKKFSDKK